MTNQSIIGKTSQEIAGQTILECEFLDKNGNKLSPIRIQVGDTTTGQQYQITSEASDHRIGLRDGGTLNKTWSIAENNLLVIAGESTSVRVITSVDYFVISELETEERTYDRFSYELN